MPKRVGTDESKEFKRTASGFRIITSNPTAWTIACIYGDTEQRISLRKAWYSFREALDWIYDYGAILSLSILQERPADIGADMQKLHTDHDTQALCGHIALHVMRKAIPLADDAGRLIEFKDLRRAVCPLITDRAIRESLAVGIARGVFGRISEQQYVVRNAAVLEERVEGIDG